MQEQSLACPLTRGKKILVGVDGSAYSDYAVDQAIMLGTACKSKIYLLSVVDLRLLPEQMHLAPELVDSMTKQAKEALQKGQDKVKQSGLECETILRTEGRAYDLIASEATKHDVDLIVIGTHGRTGLKRVVLGSVAQHVLAKTPCPVLVLPSC